MSQINVSDILLIGEQLAGAYVKWREVAQSAGATPEQLDEADARFARIRPDPLAGQPTPTPAPEPTPAPDPTAAEYDTQDEAAGKVTDRYPLVIKREDGKFSIWPVLSLPSGAAQVYP